LNWFSRNGKIVGVPGKGTIYPAPLPGTQPKLLISSQQPLFQNFTDISGTVNNTKDKNIRIGNLVNYSEFVLDDLTVFKVRCS